MHGAAPTASLPKPHGFSGGPFASHELSGRIGYGFETTGGMHELSYCHNSSVDHT